MRSVSALLGRTTRYPGDAADVPTVCRQPHILEFGVGAVPTKVLEHAHPMHLRATDRQEACAVQRVGDLVEEGGHGRKALGVSITVGANAPDVATHRVVPRHIGDVLTVRRPHRRVLDIHRLSEAFSVGDDWEALILRPCSIRQVSHPQAIQSREHDAVAVRRRPGTTNLRNRQFTIVDRVLELRPRSELLLDPRRKGDLRCFSRRHFDPHDLATVARNERAAIWRPGRARVYVPISRTAALRLVALHIHHEPVLFACRNIAQLKNLTRVVSRSIDQPPTVGARHGSERTFVFVRPHVHAARLPVQHPDLIRPNLSRRTARGMVRAEVLLEGLFDQTVDRRPQSVRDRTADIEPHEALIVAERGTEVRRRRGRTVLAMPRDLNTRAAITVVEPLLRALRRHHVFAVGRPHG